MGLLQLVSHVVQKHLVGEQEMHWDKTNKEVTSSKMVIFFVCLVPVHFLLTSKMFLYHMTDQLQRANYVALQLYREKPTSEYVYTAKVSPDPLLPLRYVLHKWDVIALVTAI